MWAAAAVPGRSHAYQQHHTHTAAAGGGETGFTKFRANIYIKIDAHYITIDGFAKYIYCVCAWKTLSATSKRVRLFY